MYLTIFNLTPAMHTFRLISILDGYNLDRQICRGVRGGDVVQGRGEKDGGIAVQKDQTRG